MRSATRLFRAALVAIASCGPYGAAHATGPEHGAPSEVHGVKLSTLCDACGVVSVAHVAHRQGQGGTVGTVAGGVLGGVIGHRIGSGGGNTAATVVGAVGGALAGNALEKRVRKVTVWSTTVVFKDGSSRTFEATTDPELQEGEVVRIEHGQPVRQVP